MSIWAITVAACLGLEMSACRSTEAPTAHEIATPPESDPSIANASTWHPEAEWRTTADGAREASTTVAVESRAPSSSSAGDRGRKTQSSSPSIPAVEATARPNDSARPVAAALVADRDRSQQALLVAGETPHDEFSESSTGEGPLRMYRGKDEPPIEIPRDEQLFYAVSINLGVLGSLTVGQVVLSSGVQAYVPALPLPGEPAPKATGREVGWIHSLATGYYLGYRLVHNLDVRLLPQDWPHIYYRDTQNGTENRRSELRIGRFNGEYTASYLADHHCGGCNNPEHFVRAGFLWQSLEHCHKCKLAEHRVWGGPESRTVPPGSSDLLSAVFLARTMVEDDRSEIVIPVVNEQKLWTLTVRAGEHKQISTPSGDFMCVLITLATAIPPGEPTDEKSFAGLFGIRGDIRIWMEEKTGVPVVIQGDLPVPVIGKLEVDVELKKYAGTPKLFVPR
jgi:hypothetical protein